MRLCINMLIFTHNLGNWLIPGFQDQVLLHGLIASVKALEYGPQCPFDWAEVCCVVTVLTACDKDKHCHVYFHS